MIRKLFVKINFSGKILGHLVAWKMAKKGLKCKSFQKVGPNCNVVKAKLLVASYKLEVVKK